MNAMELIEQGRYLGEEFLLYLWKQGLKDGGRSGAEGDNSACFVDDMVQLASESGDVKQISLKKGNPAESREAFEALSRGMRPVSAKLRLLSGELEWTFTLTAATLDLSGFRLPIANAKDPAGRAQDRLFLVEEALSQLEVRFKSFLELRASDSGQLESSLSAWIQEGLSGSQEAPFDED